jgi:nucleotide-binding universal stress UspA family protein
MPERTEARGPVIVGVDHLRPEHADAITLGAVLAQLSDTPLLLACVYEPRHTHWIHAAVVHERALHKAATRLQGRVEGLEVEELVRPGASAARVLHELAGERDAAAVVVGSSPRAAWGHVELGHVTERLMHGSGTPTVVAPRGYVGHEDGLGVIGVGYGGTPESDDALRFGTALAERAGATLRVLTGFDPADFFGLADAPEEPSELRELARERLDAAVSLAESANGGSSAAGELLDGDPCEALAEASVGLDLLVLGSRSYGPRRTVLLGGVSGALMHRAGCPVLVVPHVWASAAAREGELAACRPAPDGG